MSSCSSKLSPVISSNEDSISHSSNEGKKFPGIKNINNANDNKKSVKLPPRNKDDLDEEEKQERSSDRTPKSPYSKDSKLAVSLGSFKHLELKNAADDSCSDKSEKEK